MRTTKMSPNNQETQNENATLNEETPIEKELQELGWVSPDQFPHNADAWWRPLINQSEAWIQQEPKHYDTKIDPREFLGTAPKFTWE